MGIYMRGETERNIRNIRTFSTRRLCPSGSGLHKLPGSILSPPHFNILIYYTNGNNTVHIVFATKNHMYQTTYEP